MKKVTVTEKIPKKIIPAQERTVDKFLCEECDYETYSEEDAKYH